MRRFGVFLLKNYFGKYLHVSTFEMVKNILVFDLLNVDKNVINTTYIDSIENTK